MNRLTLLMGTLLLVWAASAEAVLYRWVDENGNTQYSDKPPANQPKGGVTELDKRGIVRKTPQPQMSEEERQRKQEAERQANEARRRDRALLQSFSRPEEVDLLRDQQIDAIQASIQTNKIKRQNASAKLDRLNEQADRYTKRKKPLPTDLETDIALAQKEIGDIDLDTQKRQGEIVEVKKRAEADKKRLQELLAGPR
ncbi:hypothetical protein GCM10007860_01660 [Chitiniphilus shinanonensis]|uniref:DUF4124 domain-containing protein n=1 Tax=Chitiniphilus shinanonensis TaxID=553088 RepID=A0ABQ6BM92_9NEIS|nr:DUF4124 domain-containing protein [Chitiniphilus shinanonensis]GLS03023.1 hypothetical protein GCM10007860_01660 [Chitiniphilus shinanonensis]